MKIKHLPLLAAGLMVAACTSPAPEGYTLTGNIEGLPDSVRVQLMPVGHTPEPAIADTIAIGGKFTFIGKVDEPRAVYLVVEDCYGKRRVMLENTDIQMSGMVKADTAWDGVMQYDMDAIAVTGSPLTARFDSLMSVREQMETLFAANQEKHKDIIGQIGEARMAKDAKKMEELQATEAYKAMAADEDSFFHLVDSLSTKTIMDNKDSYWGPLMMLSLMNYFTEEQRPMFEAMSDEAKNSYYGQLVRDELYPVGKVGSKVPEFTLKDASGKEVSLAQLCEGKKCILIDFWASWCGPCRKEIPNLKAAYKQYADKGFDIISISIDKKKADWEKALEEEQLPWNNFLDEADVAALYKVSSIPAMYLIDADGIMIGENLRGEALTEKLAEIFQ